MKLAHDTSESPGRQDAHLFRRVSAILEIYEFPIDGVYRLFRNRGPDWITLCKKEPQFLARLKKHAHVINFPAQVHAFMEEPGMDRAVGKAWMIHYRQLSI